MALLVVKLIGHAYCIMPRISKAVNAAAMASNLEYTPHTCGGRSNPLVTACCVQAAYVSIHPVKLSGPLWYIALRMIHMDVRFT